MLSPSAEPWLSRATDSAFGVKAGVSPEENMKEAALGAGTLEGTMGAGKGGGNGAWEVLEAGAEDGSRVPSEELQIADPGLGQKKSRLDCSFCAREMTDEQRAGTPYPHTACWTRCPPRTGPETSIWKKHVSSCRGQHSGG